MARDRRRPPVVREKLLSGHRLDRLGTVELMPHPAALDALQDSRQAIRSATLPIAVGCHDNAFSEEPAKFVGSGGANLVPIPREACWTLKDLLKEGLQLRTACGDLASLGTDQECIVGELGRGWPGLARKLAMPVGQERLRPGHARRSRSALGLGCFEVLAAVWHGRQSPGNLHHWLPVPNRCPTRRSSAPDFSKLSLAKKCSHAAHPDAASEFRSCRPGRSGEAVQEALAIH